ncbi:MAG: sulfurtransferase [Acidobacteriota bacterium]|nr:sulfurtransferase [Acidobacteriota bacterium]
MHKTLVSPSVVAQHLNDPSWVVIDCRFDLADPGKGEELYRQAHIPGARYAHLDRHLSGAKTGTNGRHPIPPSDEIIRTFSEFGIGPHMQVIAYDADSGMYAGRLWWMLRWMGHDGVAVLDGGLARWQRDGHPVRGGLETSTPATFRGAPRPGWRLTADDVAAGLDNRARLLVDARSNERYRGMNETLDKVAGHIPGAVNYFFQQNLADDKTFKSPEALRAQWEPVLKGHDAKDVVVYCGSGVTACHNLLALEHAGIHGAKIFPGSWSEWSSDPSRPVETENNE